MPTIFIDEYLSLWSREYEYHPLFDGSYYTYEATYEEIGRFTMSDDNISYICPTDVDQSRLRKITKAQHLRFRRV